MGTTCIPSINNRKEMVNYVKRELLPDAHDISVNGNIVYALVTSDSDGRKVIIVIKMSGIQGEWCYKVMDECMGPSYYDCPERILKQSEVDDVGFALRWREDCRQKRRDKAAYKNLAESLKPGTTLKRRIGYAMDGAQYEDVVFLRPHSATYFVGTIKGELYRIRWEDVVIPNEEVA